MSLFKWPWSEKSQCNAWKKLGKNAACYSVERRTLGQEKSKLTAFPLHNKQVDHLIYTFGSRAKGETECTSKLAPGMWGLKESLFTGNYRSAVDVLVCAADIVIAFRVFLEEKRKPWKRGCLCQRTNGFVRHHVNDIFDKSWFSMDRS